MYAGFGWKDNHFWLILFYAMFSIPFSVWILKGFIDGVSVRFDETGLVNGGSWLHIIFKVVLPQVKPGLIAAFIFNLHLRLERIPVQFHHRRRLDAETFPMRSHVGTYADGGVAWPFISLPDDDLHHTPGRVHSTHSRNTCWWA